MAQSGEIILDEVKAQYSVKDIRLVDERELEFANEYRLTFEISSAIGFALLGNVLSNFNWAFAITMVIFLLFGFYNLRKYLTKQKEMQPSCLTPNVLLNKPCGEKNKKIKFLR